MILDGRHYVQTEPRGRRRYKVRRADVYTRLAPGKAPTRIGLRYTTISSHFTYSAAARKAKRLNRERGHAQ